MEAGLWVSSLKQLSGVTYSPPKWSSAPRLKRVHAVPRVSSYEHDDQKRAHLSWQTEEGSTSASPSQRHFGTWPDAEAPVADSLHHLHAGLLLPGTPSDYHFAIQHCIGVLWKRRRTDPEAIPPLESLCLLDIAIVEAHPDFFRVGEHFVAISSARLLISLYEHAGDLDAALSLARRVSPLQHGNKELERLEKKQRRFAEELDL